MKIGLFSSDPWSRRVEGLFESLESKGAEVLRIMPWKVKQNLSHSDYCLEIKDRNLIDLDIVFVVDLGADDIGAFFHRLSLIHAIEEHGVRVINSSDALLKMRNKAECMRNLQKAGISIPETLITESIEEAADFVKRNSPCVLKPITGFGGLGVQLIEREFDLDNIFDFLKHHSRMFGKGAFLLQQYIRNSGFDIRALVVEDRVIGTMQRVATQGIVTNIHAGGIARENDIDVNIVAVEAAKAVNGNLAGVDIIPDISGKFWVLEVNATPGWAGLQTVSQIDITDAIASWLIES